MTRPEIINLICAQIRAKDYLEIGISKGQTLSTVIAPNKIGVDPAPRVNEISSKFYKGLEQTKLFVMESDAFFAQSSDMFDVVFVDGLHLYEQAIKDILNAFNRLKPGGYVIVHDLLPGKEEEAARNRDSYIWNGDVWKVMVDIHENHPDISQFVVDDDMGVGVLWLEQPGLHFNPDWDAGLVDLPFSVFETKRHEFMDIVEPTPQAILKRLLDRKSAKKEAA